MKLVIVILIVSVWFVGWMEFGKMCLPWTLYFGKFLQFISHKYTSWLGFFYNIEIWGQLILSCHKTFDGEESCWVFPVELHHKISTTTAGVSIKGKLGGLESFFEIIFFLLVFPVQFMSGFRSELRLNWQTYFHIRNLLTPKQ